MEKENVASEYAAAKVKMDEAEKAYYRASANFAHAQRRFNAAQFDWMQHGPFAALFRRSIPA